MLLSWSRESYSFKYKGELNKTLCLKYLQLWVKLIFFVIRLHAVLIVKNGRIGQFDMLGWQIISTFWVMREAWYRAVSCYSITEDKCDIINNHVLVDDNSKSNVGNVDLSSMEYTSPMQIRNKAKNTSIITLIGNLQWKQHQASTKVNWFFIVLVNNYALNQIYRLLRQIIWHRCRHLPNFLLICN